MTETEKLLSYAVDACTVVIENESEKPGIRRACSDARDLLLNALIDIAVADVGATR